MINKERIAFKPFQYQWAYEYWFKQQNAHWLHTEINMAQDIKDWNENLNEDEKKTIGNILKGFTQTETQVGNYWSSYIPQWFPVPEIKMMGQTFGAFETIHAVVRDESLHSEAGCKIFRTIIEESPDIWDKELKDSIYQGIDLAIQNEFHYIDSVFTGKGLETISKEQLKNFMLDRANRKLVELNLEPIYQVDDELFKEMKWFYILVSGEQQTDFFANRETNYSKPNEDWEEDLF